MAFCNSCGANLTPGTRFCNKCGAAILASSAAPAATPVAPATPSYAPVVTSAVATTAAPIPVATTTTGGGNALKIILIVLGVIVVIGMLGLASVGIFVHKVMKNAHVHQEGDHVKVETPFGNLETSKDSGEAAKDLGVDVYPGAQADKSGGSSASFGGIRSVAATFVSNDSVDKVCSFYKTKFPSAMVTTSGQNRCTIISTDQKNMITINIESSGDSTKLQITNVNKSAGSSTN